MRGSLIINFLLLYTKKCYFSRESYLSKDWRDGLEIMREIEEKSRNEFILNQVRD